MAALAGVAAPRGDGESLSRRHRGQPRREPPPSYAETCYPKWHYGWSELTSIRVEGREVHRRAAAGALRPRGPMPREARNLDRLAQRAGQRHGGGTEKIAGGFGAAAIVEAPQPDAETLARLRSLGYVGMTAPSRGPASAGRIRRT